MHECEKVMTDSVSKVNSLEKLLNENEAKMHKTIVDTSEEIKVELGSL